MEYIKTPLESRVKIDGVYTVHYFEYTKDFAYSGEIHNFWEIVYADKNVCISRLGQRKSVLRWVSFTFISPTSFTICAASMRQIP